MFVSLRSVITLTGVGPCTSASVEHNVFLVTPTDNNILSAAFVSPCLANSYDDGIPRPNPYYWHGRSDFDPLAQQYEPGIGSGAPDLFAIGDNEEFTSLALPPVDNEGLFTSQAESFRANTDIFPIDDGTLSLGGNLFASADNEDSPFSTDLFSLAETGISSDPGNKLLSFDDVGSNAIFKRESNRRRPV